MASTVDVEAEDDEEEEEEEAEEEEEECAGGTRARAVCSHSHRSPRTMFTPCAACPWQWRCSVGTAGAGDGLRSDLADAEQPHTGQSPPPAVPSAESPRSRDMSIDAHRRSAHASVRWVSELSKEPCYEIASEGYPELCKEPVRCDSRLFRGDD